MTKYDVHIVWLNDRRTYVLINNKDVFWCDLVLYYNYKSDL